MTDHFICRLSDRWAIFADEDQWILARCDNPKSAFRGWQQRRWRHLAFVGSSKQLLKRCLREKGAEIDNAGRLAFNALPKTFRQWQATCSREAA